MSDIHAAALKAIIDLGGNLPDDRLARRGGPIDSIHRGLMYCHARQIAKRALNGGEAALTLDLDNLTITEEEAKS